MDNKDKKVTHRAVSDDQTDKDNGCKPVVGRYCINPEKPTVMQVSDEINTVESRVELLNDIFGQGIELSEEGIGGVSYVLWSISDSLIHCGEALDKIREVQTKTA
ncbi:MAG: hypothetical protein HQK92_12610 [Nitrospirae bacterium]|nr:hypothetical protein [Nitrospirota bacterium]